MHKKDEFYMQLAIAEAKKGEGKTWPNPCVGAVIVKDDRVLSVGFHRKAGTPHAEVHAIRAAKDSLLGSTIYVTLEPCNHYGKTPPCSKLIVEHGIARVVIGMTDPNPLVDGSGIAFLEKHGLEVVTGVLRQSCLAINLPFVKYVTEGVPWVIMKSGISLDGKINYQRGRSGWITGEQSKVEVHKLRDKVDAILVGSGTVLIDNPSLTTRICGQEGKDPIRVIVDTSLRSPLSSTVFHLKSKASTMVFCAASAPKSKMEQLKKLGVEITIVEATKSGVGLGNVLKKLGQLGVCTVLVEGGARLHGSFLENGLFDSAVLFYAPVFAGDEGVSLVNGYTVKERSKATTLVDVSYRRLGNDMMVVGRFQYAD